MGNSYPSMGGIYPNCPGYVNQCMYSKFLTLQLGINDDTHWTSGIYQITNLWQNFGTKGYISVSTQVLPSSPHQWSSIDMNVQFRIYSQRKPLLWISENSEDSLIPAIPALSSISLEDRDRYLKVAKTNRKNWWQTTSWRCMDENWSQFTLNSCWQHGPSAILTEIPRFTWFHMSPLPGSFFFMICIVNI